GQYTLGVSDAPIATALSFDGLNDYLDCGNLDLAGTDFTVEFWAKRQALGRTDLAVTHNPRSPATDGALHVGFRGSNTFTLAFWNEAWAPPAYADLNWHHWAGTYARASRTRIVYRDGVEVARDTAKGPYTGSGPLRLGGADQSKAQVLLDEVRIWNRARTADELQAGPGHRLP